MTYERSPGFGFGTDLTVAPEGKPLGYNETTYHKMPGDVVFLSSEMMFRNNCDPVVLLQAILDELRNSYNGYTFAADVIRYTLPESVWDTRYYRRNWEDDNKDKPYPYPEIVDVIIPSYKYRISSAEDRSFFVELCSKGYDNCIHPDVRRNRFGICATKGEKMGFDVIGFFGRLHPTLIEQNVIE